MILPKIGPHDHPDPHTMVWTEMEIGWIKGYAAAAVAAEREACALLCETVVTAACEGTGDMYALAIRERSAV